jgi:transcriptional regulator with XRE-family HTH domain
MDRHKLLRALPSWPMAEDESTFLKRQGFWLRMARERAGKSQKGAAEYLGLSEKSKSSISDYENGVTAASQVTLRRLAKWYGVPIRLLTEPEPTIEERIDELVRLANDEERADWERGQGRAPGDEGGPNDAPRRRSA